MSESRLVVAWSGGEGEGEEGGAQEEMLRERELLAISIGECEPALKFIQPDP